MSHRTAEEWSRTIRDACAVVCEGDTAAPLGTAFFVALDILVTCRHVVEGTKRGLTIKFKGKHVDVDIIPQEPRDMDTAFLRLRGSVRVDVQPLELEVEDGSLTPGAQCFGYGFSGAAGREDEPVLLEYEFQHQNGPPFLKFRGGQVVHGMSGGPVFWLDGRKVCGVLKATRDDAQALGGRAIPSSFISERLASMKQMDHSTSASSPFGATVKGACLFGALRGPCCRWPAREIEDHGIRAAYAYGQRVASYICGEKATVLFLASAFFATPLFCIHFFSAAVSASTAFVSVVAGVLTCCMALALARWMHTGIQELLLIQKAMAGGAIQTPRSEIQRVSQCAVISRILAPRRLDW